MSKNENWEFLLEKAKEFGKTVGNAACDVVDSSKQKLEEVRLRHDLEDAYENLGRIYHELLKNGRNEPERTEQIVAEIDCLLEQLNQNKKRSKNDGTENEPDRSCPNCGAMNRAKASYCSFCGKEIRTKETETDIREVSEVPEE